MPMDIKFAYYVYTVTDYYYYEITGSTVLTMGSSPSLTSFTSTPGRISMIEFTIMSMSPTKPSSMISHDTMHFHNDDHETIPPSNYYDHPDNFPNSNPDIPMMSHADTPFIPNSHHSDEHPASTTEHFYQHQPSNSHFYHSSPLLSTYIHHDENSPSVT
jgi:hypothetical protein